MQNIINPLIKCFSRNFNFSFKIILVLYCIIKSLDCFTQSILARKDYLPQSNKTILYRETLFPTNLNAGKNQVWDYSFLRDKDKGYNLIYTFDTSESYKTLFRNVENTYAIEGDSLIKYAEESRLYKIDYQKPKLEMIFPIQYGDTISNYFEGHGKYCSKYDLVIKGEVKKETDANGILILQPKDTIKNILRVNTLTLSSIAMTNENDKISDCQLKQEVEENMSGLLKDMIVLFFGQFQEQVILICNRLLVLDMLI